MSGNCGAGRTVLKERGAARTVVSCEGLLPRFDRVV